ncbi:MAG: tyrosine-type recombinase/integrase [Actinobacteria bacterium]|uniref:Unannotated protein n=1 Tax=freshwater metagenome TaxID=449393 RepID=A0A6J6SDW3_9ZZZZ|nr:tyrosine-type recombinase/integrase [Actinomycetota bacterium]
MTTTTTLSWDSAVRDFGKWQMAGNRAPGTVRLYAYRLTDLAALTPDGPSSVTEDLLLEILSNPDWSPNTRKSVRSAYRSFFAWAVRHRDLDHNPAEWLPAIIVPRPIPRPTPEKYVHRALREAEPREEFMVRLGAYAGLRCCEICLVHEHHWDGRILTVVGKGGKTRRVAIVEPALVRMLNNLDGYAFPNRWTGQPITPGHVTKLLSGTLAETWTGHTLRHRMATVGHRGTKNIKAVSRMLGHSRLDTTLIYVLDDDDELFDVAAAAAA